MRRSRRRVVLVLVLAPAVVLGGWWLWGSGPAPDRPPDPDRDSPAAGPRAIGQGRLIGWWPKPPDHLAGTAEVTSDEASSNMHPTDYAGPDRCKSCHAKNHEAWSGHAHRLMNSVASTGTVRGDFSGTSALHHLGGRATFFSDRESAGGEARWWMRLVRGEVDRTYRVTQTIGSRFYQYYVGRLASGPEPTGHQYYTTDHVLPFGYWLDRRQWVPVVHVHRELPELDREDPFAGSGKLQRFSPYAQGCNGCHTTFALGDMFTREPLRLARHAPWQMHWSLASYIEGHRSEFLKSEPAGSGESLLRRAALISEQELQQLGRELSGMDARQYGVTLGISCEACHLGSRRHAEDPRQLPGFAPRSPHLLAETSGAEIDPGRNHTNVNWACGRCHAGSRSEFAAGMGTWNSIEYTDATRGACYSKLKCIDCHDPHQGIGRRWTRTRAQDEAVCLGCHQRFGAEAARARHTRHAAGSAGDGCLECHMPRINEGLQDVVRTHTIFSPTHAGMLESNHPNACNLCHVEKSIDWTTGWLQSWYATDADRLDLDGVYADRGGAVAAGWLESEDEAVRLVGADAVLRARAGWSLELLVGRLDDEFLINRQFASRGIEELLGVDLQELGYRFHGSATERQPGLRRVRELLLGGAAEGAEAVEAGRR
jgi:predicted CXXCH cytochrome family protein